MLKSNKVYIPIGGGLGDALQIYLANPSSRQLYLGNPVPSGRFSEFPTSDVDASLWFRRLKSLKAKHPNVSVKLKAAACNLAAMEIFEFHPYIDILESVDERPESWWDFIDSEGYAFIGKVFPEYEAYAPEDTQIYLSKGEYKMPDNLKAMKPYIVMHPFAGALERMAYPVCRYYPLVDRLIDDLDFNVVVVGKHFEQEVQDAAPIVRKFNYHRKRLYNLVDVLSVRASVTVVMHADGFIGTHSSMILCAWCEHIPSVCLVPPYHDPGVSWQEFWDAGNPTTWGASQPFNETIVIDDPSLVNDEQIIQALLSAGVKT